jgi:hypothetical protein
MVHTDFAQASGKTISLLNPPDEAYQLCFNRMPPSLESSGKSERVTIRWV